jgi:adenylate kinase family enzyme
VERILVIGSGGSGKTAFANALAYRTGLPLIHLDQEYWGANWTPMPDEEWIERVDALIATPRWIMDGNYGGTLDRRLRRADTVIWLDLPRLVCLWRVFQRWRQYRGQSRPELPEGCSERLTLEFVAWIWSYPRRQRPRLLGTLQALPSTTRVFILRTGGEVKDFLRAPPSRQLTTA